MKKLYFSDEWHVLLTKLAQGYLPLAGTLYFALSEIWGLPYAAQIVGTITAIDAFIGGCLTISTKNYKAELKNKEGDE